MYSKHCLLKKILLLSDTHSYIDNRILQYAKESDEIWHAGDIGNLSITDQLEEIKPLRAVYGNIDNQKIRVTFPEVQHFFCEKVEVIITHIGGYPGRYTQKAKALLSEYSPKLFISGHSHILKVMQDKKNDLLHMNPGAVGIHGFHKMRTMLRFEIDQQKIQNLEVIELGVRGAMKI